MDAELLEMSPPLRHYYLIRHDPVARLKRIGAQRPINAMLKQRRKDDPKYQQQETARWRAAHQARRSNEGSRTRDLFGAWLKGISERQREAYDWKTHVPVVFPEGQRMTCSVCSESRYKAKLWWERLSSYSAPETSDAKQWTCHSCYMEREMTDVLSP